MIDTVKKFNREVAKLESFKKSLLQHLQEDDEVRVVWVVDVNNCSACGSPSTRFQWSGQSKEMRVVMMCTH